MLLLSSAEGKPFDTADQHDASLCKYPGLLQNVLLKAWYSNSMLQKKARMLLYAVYPHQCGCMPQNSNLQLLAANAPMLEVRHCEQKLQLIYIRSIARHLTIDAALGHLFTLLINYQQSPATFD